MKAFFKNSECQQYISSQMFLFFTSALFVDQARNQVFAGIPETCLQHFRVFIRAKTEHNAREPLG